MDVSAYLQKHQPILYQTFSGALKENRLSHAYLVVGERGTPLRQVGQYLAESILCDSPSPLADRTCITCARFERGEYPDYRFYDGEENKIGKDEVVDLIHYFNQTPLEKKGIMVYLIHCVEGMTPDAENSLLKFLEEPNPAAYAILTTRNEAMVLPTIVSRCQSLHLLLTPRNEVLKASEEAGLPQSDAEVLSFCLNDPELIAEEMKNKDYVKAKSVFDAFASALTEGFDSARYCLEEKAMGMGGLQGKPQMRYFFEMTTLLLRDVVAAQSGGEAGLVSYAKITTALAKAIPNAKEKLLEVMKLRRQVETNINPGLLYLHLITVIEKE